MLGALLDKYADEGMLNIDDANVLKIPPLDSLGTPVELVSAFGGKPGFERAVHDLQSALYRKSPEMSVSTLVKSIQNIMRQDVGVDGDAQRISQLCWMFFLKIIDDQDQELELLKDGYRSPVPVPMQWRSWAADPEGITGEELVDFVNGDLFPQLKELPPKAGLAPTSCAMYSRMPTTT